MAKIIDTLILCICLVSFLHIILSTIIGKKTSTKVGIDFYELMRKDSAAQMNLNIILASLLMLKYLFIGKPFYIMYAVTTIIFVFDIAFLILYILNSFDFVVFIKDMLKLSKGCNK